MDVYVIYNVLCVDIYVISLFVLMENKKTKKAFFPSLPSATLGKEGFAEWHDHDTLQSWEADNQFPSFAECQSPGTRQRIFLKKILCRVQDYGTQQRNFKKKERILGRVPPTWHSAKRPSQLTAEFFYRVLTWHSAKKPLPTGSLLSALRRVQYGLCRVPQALGKEPVCNSDALYQQQRMWPISRRTFATAMCRPSRH
jgi:hypothetical protein